MHHMILKVGVFSLGKVLLVNSCGLSWVLAGLGEGILEGMKKDQTNES